MIRPTSIYMIVVPVLLNSFFLSMDILIRNIRPDIVDKENRVESVSIQELLPEYDYVIIGGGSAGAVVANRLSENKNCTVLLLEAGGDENIITDLPLATTLYQNASLDWGFKVEPSSNYCLGMKNHQCAWPRGKVLGGSSVLNGMLYIRANKKNYDSWADLGNEGWDYKHVLPYFKKSEDVRAKELINSSYHQTGGYLTVEQFKYIPPIVDYIMQSANELGYKVKDINGESQTGFSYAYGTLRDGLRCSTAKAFIRSVAKRANLHVSLESVVEKLLVKSDGTSKAAHGVLFRKDKKQFTVRANREIILSAGSIKSPHLLLLSGIGPRDHLKEMKIPVVHHAPGVGKNLQDHVGMAGISVIIDPSQDIKDRDNITGKLSNIISVDTAIEMLQNNSGPLFMNVISGGHAFINTKYANKTNDFPDIQVMFSALSDWGFESAKSFQLEQEIINSLYWNITGNFHSFGVFPLLLRPRSRGYLKLKSANPDEAPAIVPNYFDDPHDLQVLIESIKFVEQLIRSKVMQRLNARLNPNKMSSCSQFDGLSDEYWACYARHFTSTIYHPIGTCKMGPASDPYAVVDARLRVHGVSKLRVIDASIMPLIVSGNTNAPTIMIGEKGADMIKEDWSQFD